MRIIPVLVSMLLVSILFFSCAPPEEDLTAEQEIARFAEKLPDLKMELAMENKYACCLKEGCNMCLLAHASCPCYNNIREGKPVCGECYAGWHQGKGIDTEFSIDDVKLDLEHDHGNGH